MIRNVKNAVVGTQVLLFNGYSKFPTVTKITRVTENFVFIEKMNFTTQKPYEVKFRRDGSAMESHSREHLVTPEAGDIEGFEKAQKDEKRINEIRTFLESKGFRFNGYNQWYSIEQWEKLFSALN